MVFDPKEVEQLLEMDEPKVEGFKNILREYNLDPGPDDDPEVDGILWKMLVKIKLL